MILHTNENMGNSTKRNYCGLWTGCCSTTSHRGCHPAFLSGHCVPFVLVNIVTLTNFSSSHTDPSPRIYSLNVNVLNFTSDFFFTSVKTAKILGFVLLLSDPWTLAFWIVSSTANVMVQHPQFMHWCRVSQHL